MADLTLIVNFLYGFLANVYFLVMKNDLELKKMYRAKSDKDWSEICFAMGIFFPFAFLINKYKRFKYA